MCTLYMFEIETLQRAHGVVGLSRPLSINHGLREVLGSIPNVSNLFPILIWPSFLLRRDIAAILHRAFHHLIFCSFYLLTVPLKSDISYQSNHPTHFILRHIIRLPVL
jgi:hypothetical protein